MGRLTKARVEGSREKGCYGDGDGLYLQVSIGADGMPRKSWVYRFTSPVNGKERLMGLGALRDVSLAEARSARDRARAIVRQGCDPIEERKLAKVEDGRFISFDQCASVFIEAHRAGWRSEKHLRQWRTTLASYASPVFGHMPVSNIDTSHVIKVLEPIWTSRPVTAVRLRERIEAVLDSAAARGYRSSEKSGEMERTTRLSLAVACEGAHRAASCGDGLSGIAGVHATVGSKCGNSRIWEQYQRAGIGEQYRRAGIDER